MSMESPRVHRERVIRAARRRARPRVRLVAQLIWIAVFLAGGAAALAEGDHRTALIGFAGSAILVLLNLAGALRRRRLRSRSWRAS